MSRTNAFPFWTSGVLIDCAGAQTINKGVSPFCIYRQPVVYRLIAHSGALPPHFSSISVNFTGCDTTRLKQPVNRLFIPLTKPQAWYHHAFVSFAHPLVWRLRGFTGLRAKLARATLTEFNRLFYNLFYTACQQAVLLVTMKMVFFLKKV